MTKQIEDRMPENFDPKSLIKVLVIDQNEIVRSEIRAALEDNYLILEANTGINGIDLAIDTDPDLIFIDVELQDLNGFEIFNEIIHINTLFHTSFLKRDLSATAKIHFGFFK